MAGAGPDRSAAAPGFPHAWFDRPIADLFGDQARRHPDALAVKSARHAVVYGEVAAAAERIAWRGILSSRRTPGGGQCESR